MSLRRCRTLAALLLWDKRRGLSTADRVYWQDLIAEENRYGHINNTEALKLHALLKRKGGKSKKKSYAKRKRHYR